MPESEKKGDVLRLITLFRLLAGVALGAALYVSIDRLAAQEYCVSCTEPPGLYRCIIEGARPGGSQPLQMLCITAMAKEGQHATCAVKGGTVFDCNGQVKRVPWAAYNEPGPGGGQGQEQAKTPAAQPPAKNPSEPPATVEEMARRANEKSAEQAKALGQSVGDATKKTWQCIASLFTKCGE
jgi:hypothetical protein